ncbi:DUF4405 domain-containing protein [Gorillibacterium sp. sgz5001074]|uniref:DUF4405 domain-containing protein n=1 Tax=Gorillibacterium sp. sgz5001074 TaxID=3446695 RepID=UPI003F66C469
MNTKRKNVVKLVLDMAMGVTFALLFNKRVLGGLAFHEIAGIAIGFAILMHILLNYRFVQKITMRLFDNKLPGKTRLSYFLNLLLLICMGFVMISGLLISKVVLPGFRYGNENWFKLTHMGVSYLTLVLIGVHIGLHWHWVMSMFQRLLHLKMPKLAARFVMIALAVLVLGYGSYQMYDNQFLNKLQMVQNVFQVSSVPAGHAGMEGGRPQGMRGQEGGQQPGGQASGASANGAGGRPAGKPGGAPGGAPSGAPGRGMASPSFYSVILTYFGIMAVFAGITYYLDKLISIRRKRIRQAAA